MYPKKDLRTSTENPISQRLVDLEAFFDEAAARSEDGTAAHETSFNEISSHEKISREKASIDSTSMGSGSWPGTTQTLSGLKHPSDDLLFSRFQNVEYLFEEENLSNKNPLFTDVGSVLDQKYRITKKIAESEMGVVFEAVHQKLDKKVAIKVISPKMLRDEESRRRFVREAKASTLLSSHHTVRVYDYNVSALGEPYLVLEFISGENLEQTLQKTGALEVERVVYMVKQIAQSLMEAHENHLVHRDLKPSNIMLMDTKGHKDFVKIFDLGVIKFTDASDDDLTQQGVSLGTPRYMAPEQILSPQKVSYPADIFSLGLILCSMLTGKKPYADLDPDQIKMERVQQKTLVLPKDLSVPSALRDLYQAMVAYDPAKRPTAEEVFARLARIEFDLQSASYSGAHSFDRWPSPTRSALWTWLIGGVFLVVLLLLALRLVQMPSPETNAQKYGVSRGMLSPSARPEATSALPNAAFEKRTSQDAKKASLMPKPSPTTSSRATPPPRPAPREVAPTARIDQTHVPTARIDQTQTVKPPPLRALGMAPSQRRGSSQQTKFSSRRLVRILSQPTGAQIYGQGGELLGKTPFVLTLSKGRSATIQIKKGGYVSQTLTIPFRTKKMRYVVRLRELTIELP